MIQVWVSVLASVCAPKRQVAGNLPKDTDMGVECHPVEHCWEYIPSK